MWLQRGCQARGLEFALLWVEKVDRGMGAAGSLPLSLLGVPVGFEGVGVARGAKGILGALGGLLGVISAMVSTMWASLGRLAGDDESVGGMGFRGIVWLRMR